MKSSSPIDISPRRGVQSAIERTGGGEVRMCGRAAKQSGEVASSEAAPAQRTGDELNASDAVPAACAPRTECLDVSARLVEFRTLGMPALRGEWRRLFRRDAPRLSRDQMMRGIAYRIQENAFGGLPNAVEPRLAKLMATFESEGRIVAPSPLSMKPGARLIREWRGRTHVVPAVDNGFEYEGKTFTSLAAIAVEITGARWSGPRFFGLARRRGAKKAGAGDDKTDGESDEVQLSTPGCSLSAGRSRDGPAGTEACEDVLQCRGGEGRCLTIARPRTGGNR
jgi:Protein of unknown function (DUF2924)